MGTKGEFRRRFGSRQYRALAARLAQGFRERHGFCILGLGERGEKSGATLEQAAREEELEGLQRTADVGADEILHEVQHGEGARKVGRPFCNGVEGGCEEVLRPAEGAGIHKHGFVQAPAALAEHSAALQPRTGCVRPSTSATGSPQPTQTSRLGRRPEKARIFNSSAAESAARWLSSAPSMASSMRIADWNRRGLARSRWLMRASSSATGAAAAEASRLQRKASWAGDEPRLLQNVETSARRAQGVDDAKGLGARREAALGPPGPFGYGPLLAAVLGKQRENEVALPSFVRRSTRARRE